MVNAQALRQAVDRSIRLSVERGYVPTRFMQMWAANPTLQMLEGMVVSGEIQTGLSRLAAINLLDHSVEQIVIDYSSNRSIVAAAKWRLEQVRT